MRIAAVMSLLSMATLAASAQATVLGTVSVSVVGTGGSGGSGTGASDMVFATYSSDGWGWAGGAGGVQGNSAKTNNNASSVPSNEVFRFSIGSQIDTYNALYGEGNWTVENIKLTFASSYAKQNNSRFGVGSGTYDVYWVENDNWAQSRGTETDKGLNPIYASDAATLEMWANSVSLLSSNEFTVPVEGGTYVTITSDLSSTSLFVQDILSANSTSGDISLYLMGTSDTLGMIIFTGGQNQITPTLSFDIISVPEPASIGILALVGAGLLIRKKK